MIFNLVELKEAFIAKFGDDGLKIWDCLDHKRSYANYLLGYTNSPDYLIDYHFEEDLSDDMSNEELEYLSSQYEDEDYVEEDCDYESMNPVEYPMEEMTHFMISTVDLGDGDYDTIFGYAKLNEKGTVECMNVSNYGDRKIPYTASYHNSIMKDEQECLPSEILGLFYDKTESGKTDRDYKYYRTFYSIIKK